MTRLLHTLMDSSLLILSLEANLFLVRADNVKIYYPGKIQTQDQAEFLQNLQSFAD